MTLDPFNVGGAVALTDFIDVLKSQSTRFRSLSYSNQIAKHLEKVSIAKVIIAICPSDIEILMRLVLGGQH